MTNAVVVENVSKMYRLGQSAHHGMLREAIVSLVKRPFTKAQALENEGILWALKDVSFNVNQGEVVGVIGRNGAGKSTLLKLISRITYPTKGRVQVRGRFASLLEVGTGFHPELSGRENIFLNGSILGMTSLEVKAKLEEIVAFAGVERFLDTPIKRYSSGMRLRLGFAVAAHLEPDVLIVDEVLAVGDVAFQRKCLAAMDDLRSEGRTVVFVSHNMEAVENLCPRCIWIEAGRVRRDGPNTEVISAYMNSYDGQAAHSANLSDFADRRGNGDGRIVGFEILDGDRRPTSFIRGGQPAVLRLHYEVFQKLPEPHFGVRIMTSLGTLVTELSTWSTGLEIPELNPGEGSIDFEIDQLNLMGADYRLGFWLQSVGPIEFDIIENCGVLSVLAGNVFDTGRGMTSRWGVTFFNGRWKMVARSKPASPEGAGTGTSGLPGPSGAGLR